jgi:hypothetical protein
MKKSLSLILIFILVSCFFSGCEKDKGVAPTIPPIGTMTIDFSNFTSGNKLSIISTDLKNVSGGLLSNWQFAATVAGFWNWLLTVNLAVPVASFHKAIETSPTNIGSNKWEWKFDVNVVGAVYKARLTGELRDKDVKWEMYITKDGVGGFPEFLWFNGTSMLDMKSGQWILNHSQLYQEPLLQIDWTRKDTTIGTIRYTYIRDLNDNRATDKSKGSYIEYGLTNNDLNAYYNIHIYESTVLNSFTDVNIEWSTTNHNGHVKAYYFYQDNIWHCWNSSGNDVICN